MRDKGNEIDPRGAETRAALRVVGLCMVTVGAVMTAIGLISFFSAFATFGPPRYFWCAIVGLPLLGFGLQLSGLGFLGAFTRYVSGQTAPVHRDTFNYLAEGTRGGVQTIAGAAAEGFAAGTRAQGGVADRLCPQCQSPNASGARFCEQCGTALAPRACPRCRHENESAARFCTQCGCQLV